MSSMVEGTAPERRWNRGRYPLQTPSRTSHSTVLEPPPMSPRQSQDSNKTFPSHAGLANTTEPQQVHFQTIDCGGRDENSGSEIDVKENREGHRSLRRTKRSWQLSASAPPALSEDWPILDRSSEIERIMLAPGSHKETSEPQSPYPRNGPRATSNGTTEWLQSSVSGSSVSPPSTESVVQPVLDHAAASPSDRSSHVDGLHPRSQMPAKESKHRRQVYPLQSLTSIETLRSVQTLPLSLPRGEGQQTDTMDAGQRGAEMQISKTGKTSRTAYHLQSFSSIANLQRPPSPPSSPESASRDTNKSSTDHTIDDEKTSAKTKASRRQAYPLQSQSSVANLQCSPSSFGSANTVSSAQRHTDFTRRENALAAGVIKQWQRQTYPLQSPDNVPIHDSPSPSHGNGSKIKCEPQHSGPIHLPKHVRAFADAKDHDQSGRTIVVCLDGTGDKFDNDNSNIVHLVSALKKDDPRQVTYYQAGIGTYGESGLSGGLTAAMDMAIGSGLGMHVREAYHFLMHTYKEGDKICIFGFSRGAYTARCLAGMVHKVGLLPARNVQQIPFAYEFYKDGTPQGWKQSWDFKRAFCIDVNVCFLGVFDSVASVGFIPRQLPLSSTPNNKPRYFRHAMALDERRAKFKICRHQKTDWDDIHMESTPAADSNYGKSKHPGITEKEYEDLTGDEVFDTDVLEVWFAGAHADVGGGAVANTERHKLAQIPLRWMIREAFKCNTGIIFKTVVLAEYGLDVHTLWPVYSSLNIPDRGPPASVMDQYHEGLPPRSVRRAKLVPIDKHDRGEQLYHLKSHTDLDWTPEQLEDCFDARSPMNDQLVQAPNWWILEFLPMKYEVPTALGKTIAVTGMNLGRYRAVEDAEPSVHWTVLYRSQHMGYKIQARTAVDSTWQPIV